MNPIGFTHHQPARVVGLSLLAVGALLAAACGSAAVFYLAGNGITPGLLAFVAIPLIPGALGWGALTGDRRAVNAAFALSITEAGYAWYRVADVRTDGPLTVCEDGQCPALPPWASRLIREEETSYAAMQVAGFTGLLTDAELTALRSAFGSGYDDLRRFQGAHPSVNALLLGSGTPRVTELVSMPAGRGPVGALVFLHGWGGQLSPCPAALAASDLGRDYAIVAPVLGRDAAWWTDEGERVVLRTLETLPPRVDRDRVWLIGLSNGAIGASRLSVRPQVARRVRGVVLLMGGASVELSPTQRPPPTLLVPARHDTRFPYAGIASLADELRATGADVTLRPVDGDHFVLMSHPGAVTSAIEDWLHPQ